MPIEMLIKHCAPTLAGLKVGNLFNCKFDNIQAFKLVVEKRNKILNPKGIYISILRVGKHKVLIYVYRKSQLESQLKDKQIQLFLQKMGYEVFGVNECIELLKSHINKEDFPHEIGIFLGYPLQDVKGFIEHKGANCTCCGHWKSYSDADSAKKIFAKYDKCTKIYCKKYAQGFDINRLVVAV